MKRACLIALALTWSLASCGGGGEGGDGNTSWCCVPEFEPPLDQVVAEGSTAVISVQFKGGSGACGTTGKWQRNGVDIPGTLAEGCITPLVLLNVSALDNGANFRAVARYPDGTTLVSNQAKLTVAGQPPRVNATGVDNTQCYRAGSSVLVNCDSREAFQLNDSQDGMRIAPFAFSNVGTFAKSECFRDDATGLIWEGTKGLPAYLTYAGAREYVSQINRQSLCGFSDWRIPALSELYTIMIWVRSPYLMYWVHAGTDRFFWTSTIGDSTSYCGDHVRVLGDQGSASVCITNAEAHMRLVRGNRNDLIAPEERYSISADNSEVLDLQTGLVWKRCSEGRTWDGTRCNGAALHTTREDALAYARGSGGWRLPSIAELIASFMSSSAEYLGTELSESVDTCMWSSTPYIRPSNSYRDAPSAFLFIQREGGFLQFSRSSGDTPAGECGVRLVR